MSDNPDWWARGIAGFSTSLGLVAIWLNWQKNKRDLAAMRPQVSIRADRRGTRKWFIHLTVMNPLQVPIAWQKVRAVSPAGLQVISKNREEANEKNSNPPLWEYSNFYFVENYPIIVEPGKSAIWEGYASIADRFAAPENASPIIEPVIDGFFQEPGRWRRVAKWILIK